NPTWFLALGRANEGKTVISEASAQFMPEDALSNGRVSNKAIHRKSLKLGSDYIDRQTLRMGDLGGKKDIEKWEDTLDIYKELSTEGHAELEVTQESVDEETGERGVILFKVEGKPSVSLTSVNSEAFDDQILSRSVTVSPVATNEEVRLFFYYDEGKNHKKKDYIISQEVGLLQEYIQYTKEFYIGVKVINPYWTCLEEWFHSSEFYKRALSLYPSLVKAVAILNQEFRSTLDIDNELFIVATKEDNQLIADLFNPSQGISEPAVRLFNLLLKWFKKFNYGELDEYQKGDLLIKNCETMFTVGEINHRASKIKALKGLKYGEIITSLVTHGLIEAVDKMNRGNKNIYILSHFEKLESAKINFDENKINKYISDLEGMYGLTPHTLLKIKDQENGDKDSDSVITNLEYPPWSVKVPDWVPRDAAERRKVVSKVPQHAASTDEIAAERRKVTQEPMTNNDKSLEDQIVKEVESNWGAF
ncbi:MAG: hypothetical protein ABFC34_17635, partial [Methanobacterium sp.]